MKQSVAILILILTVGLSACSSSEQGISTAEGSKALPSDTATDWATYGDHLVELEAITAQRLPPPQDQVERGEGVITRTIEFKVGASLWSRPSFDRRAELPDSFTVANGGWTFHGDKEEPWRVRGQIDVTPGHKYLAIFTYGNLNIAAGDGSGKPEWFVLDLLPYDDGVVSEGDDISGKDLVAC